MEKPNNLFIDLKELKSLLSRQRARRARIKNLYGEGTEVNYFDRIKALKKPYTEKYNRERFNIFFDTETYEYYTEKDNPNELPLIVPYAVGLCTDEPGSYIDFIGPDAAIQFFDRLIEIPQIDRSNLLAFNLDYDFHAIRPFIYERNKWWCNFSYQMTEEKKFIHGSITSKDLRTVNKKGNPDKKPRVDIKFIDLWNWDRTQSLRTYINNILKLTYDNEGNVKKDEIALILDRNIKLWGFTKDSFKKLEIDYRKVNLHKEGDKWFYWSSKEDWINNVNKKELDLSPDGLERTYLRIDVTSLPIVHLEQRLMKEMALKTIGITQPIDMDSTITAPSFAKYLLEEYEKKYMTETYRWPVTPEDNKAMFNSYTGAFVGGNRDITYLDEEVFKKLYPNKSFYDPSGKPIIKSYDVNSMYPWAMSLGLPFGPVWDFKPNEEHITWYEIQFTDYIDPETKTLYKWKDKYSYLNNTFFGDNFHYALVPNLHADNKVYVLKELYDLFLSMNDAKCKIVATRYQRVSRALIPFVEGLYKIKRNDPNPDGTKPYTDSTVALIKLLLNSLYGKTAEKFRMYKHVWASNIQSIFLKNWYLFDRFDELGITVIDDEIIKRQKFKSNIAPYLNPEDTSGFYTIESRTKRFNKFDDEMRESITAGIFITSISRHKLLSTVKNEIDQGNVVLYCDTDSIKLIEFKPPKFQCHDKDLGAWKYEGCFHYFGHPNVLKKYFMFNPTQPIGSKFRWMVKASGFDDSKLRKKGEEDFNLETIKLVYNPDNRVIIENCKPNNKRNGLYQIVIGRTDFKFAFKSPKDKVTHRVKNGIVYHE